MFVLQAVRKARRAIPEQKATRRADAMTENLVRVMRAF
jgi:hypothetical protein